jgi:hypothetical protein
MAAVPNIASFTPRYLLINNHPECRLFPFGLTSRSIAGPCRYNHCAGIVSTGERQWTSIGVPNRIKPFLASSLELSTLNCFPGFCALNVAMPWEQASD